MKRFFIITICMLIAAAVIASLCACGKTDEPVETKPEETTVAETTAEITESESANELGNLFDKGVWSASIDGKIDTYFVFYDETSGKTVTADGKGGVGFTCEQSGLNIVFHFGSADDGTKAVFRTDSNIGTFYYGDKTVDYTFEFIEKADADNFEAPVK